MKEYCVDLEIAKELKENGYPQNSCYFFADFGSGYSFGNGFATTTNKVYSPTSDEILKELPINIDGIHNLTIHKGNKYNVNYQEYNNHPNMHNKKFSNALAKMWLYLKKEGYIK